jgi:hypothetical protein
VLTGLLIPHGWHGNAVITGERMIPTVGHVRDLLVFALRHVVEAEEKRIRTRRVFRGIDNRRAIELLRSELKGRDRRLRVSQLTWQIARDLGNATKCTSPAAWWNTKRWILADMRVNRRVAVLRGEA